MLLDGDERLAATSVVLATGVAYRRVDVPGADRFLGAGIYYGAARTEMLALRGGDAYLVGSGNSAGQAALFFVAYATRVTLIVRRAGLEETMSSYLVEQIARTPTIRILGHAEVVAVDGDTHLRAITVRDCRTDARHRIDTDALFVFIGGEACTGWLPAGIARDDDGYILTGRAVREDPTGRAGGAAARSPVPENQRPGHLRRRGCAARLDQAGGGRRGGGQHGHRAHPHVPQRGRRGWGEPAAPGVGLG